MRLLQGRLSVTAEPVFASVAPLCSCLSADSAMVPTQEERTPTA